MTQYRTLLEQVLTIAAKYNLTGVQLNTVFKIQQSLNERA